MSNAASESSSPSKAAAEAADAGHALFGQGRFPEAAEQFGQAIQQAGPRPDLHLNLALSLEAAEQWEAAWDAAGPAIGSFELADRAAALLARLAAKLNRDPQALDYVLAALLQTPTDMFCRRQLHFAAATLLERLGRYDEAFGQARSAHQIFRPAYDPAARSSQFELRLNHWTPQRIQSLHRATHGNSRPVFIVGMPRSGTSLIEQILSCHPQIFAAGELGELGKVAMLLDSTGLPYPRSLESLSADSANRIARSYLDAIGALNRSAPYVTDKMPLNFMYLELVEALLPQSHVIHCTRDPLDTCLSCYMTDFATPYDFASDLTSLGQFYRLYVKMMEHWKRVLTLPILDVRYEDVVGDVEAQTRRMLDFLNLPWEPRCLDFHKSTRPVATASSEQVRRPIYRSSVGRRRKYEPHLHELIDMLDGQ